MLFKEISLSIKKARHLSSTPAVAELHWLLKWSKITIIFVTLIGGLFGYKISK